MNALPVTSAAVGAPELWITVLKSVAMLCVVLGILIGVLLLMRRVFYHRGAGGSHGLIRMLASYYVAPKERIVLMDVLGEKILIGVTPQAISCLARIDPDSPAIGIQEAVPTGLFTNLLKGVMGRSSGDGKKGEPYGKGA